MNGNIEGRITACVEYTVIHGTAQSPLENETECNREDKGLIRGSMKPYSMVPGLSTLTHPGSERPYICTKGIYG